jgi:hypothetical protein
MLWLARRRAESLLSWAVDFMLAGGMFSFFYFTGTWVFLSYYLRYVFLLCLLLVALLAYRRHRGRPMVAGSRRRRGSIGKTAALILILGLNALIARGYRNPGHAVDLAFPLQGGTYCVIQGGSNFVTNPFHNFVDAEHALDIVKVNRYGQRGRRVFSRDLHHYEIYGDTVYSPCSGTILRVVDSLHENVPPQANSISPLGNHIVITADGVHVIIAHMMKGAALVGRGQRIATGQPIGRVGNSGYSNEPHLHLQAIRDGAGVEPLYGEPAAITFDGKYLAINDLFRSERSP